VKVSEGYIQRIHLLAYSIDETQAQQDRCSAEIRLRQRSKDIESLAKGLGVRFESIVARGKPERGWGHVATLTRVLR